MIKEAINRIIELSDPKEIKINGESYSNQILHRVANCLPVETLDLNSLKGVIDYIKSNISKEFQQDEIMLHIVTPTQVKLISTLNNDLKRDVYVNAVAPLSEFRYGRKYPSEEFVINMQSNFTDYEENNDKAIILKFAGTVKNGSVTEYGDDGVSQKASVKVGVASLADAEVPSPCHLYPYRTFVEVSQPGSDFIFRLFDNGNAGVECSLFEADGGAWRLEAKENILNYLNKELLQIGLNIPIVM